MSRGFLIHAHNNEQVDYGLLALANALMIKKNLRDNAVALVTDDGTLGWLRESRGADLVARAFDDVIVQPYSAFSRDNHIRRFGDGDAAHTLPWHNWSRASSYDLSPFDETVLIDADYLVMDRTLDLVWGTDDDLRINRTACDLDYAALMADSRLESSGIPLYWATCVYFRKGDTGRTLFDMIEHVRENYDYYQHLYGFPGTLYRNDFVFSIAVHTMNGFVENGTIPSLPCTLVTCLDRNDIHAVPALNEMTFLVKDPKESWRFRLCRTRGLNVHVLNKFALIRHAPTLLELYA